MGLYIGDCICCKNGYNDSGSECNGNTDEKEWRLCWFGRTIVIFGIVSNFGIFYDKNVKGNKSITSCDIFER